MATMTPTLPTTTTPIPIVSIDPMPKRWTCAEFHDLGDRGVFAGKRAILIGGVILEQGPMNPLHAITLELVDEVLRARFGQGWRFRIQIPLVFGQDTDPMPDIAILPGGVRSQTSHPTTATLVIEVSDTTLRFDITVKRLLYARGGIPEYWVIDTNSRVMHVYRDPDGDDYRSEQTLTDADNITPLALAVSIKMSDLFMPAN